MVEREKSTKFDSSLSKISSQNVVTWLQASMEAFPVKSLFYLFTRLQVFYLRICCMALAMMYSLHLMFVYDVIIVQFALLLWHVSLLQGPSLHPPASTNVS